MLPVSDATSNDQHSRPIKREALRRRARYLPSAQVVEELSGVSSLGTLAEELRNCLTDAPGQTAAAGQP